jgi:putative two-component system response regulator
MTTIHDPQSAPPQAAPRNDAPLAQFASADERQRTSKILIVDDEPVNILVAQKYLSLAGFKNFVTTSDPRDAIRLAYLHQPDLVLLDIMMPEVSGLDILAGLGASDFLSKPVDPTDMIPRVQNVLTVKQYHDHLREYSHRLEAEVLRRTAELARSRQEVIHCLARAAEFRDDATGKHVFRVGRYARIIAEEMGWSGERLEMLEQAAQLHDIGKIGVPDAILLKPSKLTAHEFEIMQKHSDYGRQIMGSLPEHEQNKLTAHTELGARILDADESPILTLAATIALSHHEKWNGQGYPLGLVGEDIPIEGRITAVADVFDALSSKRPYKPAYSIDHCFQVLEEGRGTHFDPQVLDAFFRRRSDIVRTLMQYADMS